MEQDVSSTSQRNAPSPKEEEEHAFPLKFHGRILLRLGEKGTCEAAW